MLRNTIFLTGLLILTLPFPSFSQLLQQPESAVYDLPRSRYLVSNYYDGRLIAIDSNGAMSVFAEGKSSSAGLHIIDDTVYVGCGGEGVLAYNLVTGEVVMDLLIPGSVLLNDVTADTSGNLYVSDPYGNKVYKIVLSDRSYSVLVNNIVWPNGLLFNKRLNRLLVCTSTTQKIYSVNMDDGSLTELVDVGTGHLDGLAEDNVGNIYVSSQGPEAVYRYNSDFTSPRELVASGFSGPADIYYNKWFEVLVVPNIAGNTVDFIDLPVPTNLITSDFSDVNFGDGDGILEGGEEIELSFSFANSRSDSMINTSVEFYCQDISLTINNGHIDFGDLAPDEIVDNSSTPMRFTIPVDYAPRIDTFYIEIDFTYLGRTKQDIVPILQSVGFPKIILVDDFAGEGISDYYADALNELMIPSTSWDIETMGIPSSSILNGYPVMIWFTGNSGADSINADHILRLQNYMDNGGSLFLTGQGIAANIDSSDVDFLNNYLRCEQVAPYYIGGLTALPAAQVFDEGDSLMIFGGDGASNQSNTDQISALNGGVEELDYLASDKCGAVSYDGTYRLVFFAFGFEAIRSDNSRFLSRHNTLLKILDFFQFEFPNNAPIASDLIIGPGNPTHMLDHTPSITWIYADAETTPQAYYQIQAGDDDDWLVSELWDTGPVSGSETNVLYSGSELTDGADYYVRVRLCDGSLWSDWINGTFHMNSVPVPVDLTPNNLENIAVNPPVLSHAFVPDIENDVLTYDYQLYDDVDMTVLLVADTGLIADPGERIYWTIDTLLNVNEDYFWRVRCNDGYEIGAWSEMASFMLIPPYICGDADGDSAVNIGDAVFLINYIFKGGPAPDPLCSGDVNADGTVNIGDAVYLINYIFKGGPAPECDCA